MKDVLVAFGSKMGGTAGLAEAVALRLRERGLEVEASPAGAVDAVAGYRAIVLGSAIYTNKWRPEALRLLRRIAAEAADTPIWIFHSGPLGDRADEAQKLPKKADVLVDRLDVRDIRTFGGRLPVDPPGLMARLVARRQAGDFRNFDDVVEWADSIAAAFEQSDVAG